MPGVRDSDIDRPELLVDCKHQGVHRCGVGDVEGMHTERRGAAHGANFGGRFFEGRGIATDDRHGRSVPRQINGDRPPDPAA